MPIPFAAMFDVVRGLLNALLVLSSLFLICLVLIQRGKGGGLAGAFGGVGGSSAFGTKAGDVFTRITIVVAAVWCVLSLLLVILSNRGIESAFPDAPRTSRSSTEVPPTTAGGKSRSKTTPSPLKSKTTTPSPSPGPAPTSVPAIPPSESK